MNPRLALDLDVEALTTYQKNFPEAHVVPRDIRRVSTRDVERYFDKERVRPILLISRVGLDEFEWQRRFAPTS